MFTRTDIVGAWPARASSAVSRQVQLQPAIRRTTPGFRLWRDTLERQQDDAGRAWAPPLDDDGAAREAALAAVGGCFEAEALRLDARVVGRSQRQISVAGRGFSEPTIESVNVDVRSRHDNVVIDHADTLVVFDRAGLARVVGTPATCAALGSERVETGSADDAVERALRLLSVERSLQHHTSVRFMPTTVGPRYLALDVESSRSGDVPAGIVLRAGWRLEFATDFARIVVRFEVDGEHRVSVGFMDG